MEKGTTYLALDDSKRKIVAGILRPDAAQPELRDMPNESLPHPPLVRAAQARGDGGGLL